MNVQHALEYLEMHPELQKSNDSLEKSQDQPASFDDLKSKYGIGVQGFTAPEVAENSLSEQIRDAHEIAERHQALRDEYTEKMAILNTDERIDYIKTNPLELSVGQLQDTLDTFSLIQQIELAQQQDLLPEELAASLTLGMGELAVTAPINWSVKMMANVAAMPSVAMGIDYDAIREDLMNRYSIGPSENLDRLMQPIHEALAPTLQEIYQSSVDQYGEEQAKLMLKGLEGLGDLLMVSMLARAPIEMAVDRQELQKLVHAELNSPDKVMRIADELKRELERGIFGPNEGRGYAKAVMKGGNGRTIAGHGQLDAGAGTFIVPEGTTLIVPRDGIKIHDMTGQVLEHINLDRLAQRSFSQKGLSNEVRNAMRELNIDRSPENTKHILEDLKGLRIIKPGEQLENYTISAPTGLNTFENSTTVNQRIPLSEIIEPDGGVCALATCTNYIGR